MFEGRPDELAPRAQQLIDAAEAITAAADALRDLVADQRSLATDSAGKAATDAADALTAARGRYAGTGRALRTYAVDLEAIQRTARVASDQAGVAEDHLPGLEGEVRDLQTERVRVEATGTDAQIDTLDDDTRRAHAAVAQANAQLDAARRVLSDAREDIYQAASRAIERIETAIADGADTWADNWDQFWEGVGNVLSVIGEWVKEFLAAVVEALQQMLLALVAALVVLLLVVIVAALAGLIFTLFGAIGLVLAAALVAALLLMFVLREALGTPKAGPSWVKDFADDPDYVPPAGYGDLIQQVGDQDRLGGEDSTEIRVVAITDDAGTVVGWRVQLPSTQNWSPFNTSGGVNDLSADAVLSLAPGVRTQYEKAVWDAMQKAGVMDSDAPIMFTGWSLGGMMAGKLASDPSLAGRVGAVVTAGSAIDKQASEIPGDVRVTQFNNAVDPVHTLEFVGLDPSDYIPRPNWETHRTLTWPVHDSSMYADQARSLAPDVRPGDEVFFANESTGTHEVVWYGQYSRK